MENNTGPDRVKPARARAGSNFRFTSNLYHVNVQFYNPFGSIKKKELYF